MRAGEVPPGPASAVRAEVVHESETTRVTRLYLPGRTVVRKEPLGPDALRRLRNESAMLTQLRGVAGIAQQAVEAPAYPGSLVLADAGGTSLAGLAKPLAMDDLVGLAVGLARAVGEMHRRGVLHRDICPANVVVSGDRDGRGGTPCLVDFALATAFAELRPEFTHPAEVVGTLAYLAPEQTGRTGRPVDQRADLYALGAMLYELATGQPPFGAGDPLRLTHDHLAVVPTPPSEVNPAVPAPLSAIIMHLLEKEPDRRYQTAEGVVYDLERVRDARTDPATAALRVGERDVPLLLPPSRLVGRDGEVAALEEAFADAQVGRCRGVLVGGSPGVGKTALADQLRPVVTGADGWFVAGKFDPHRRDLEFDAGLQAFRALGRLLLAEPESELAAVRDRILAAVGANAGLVTATVPEFAALLAVPPEAGDPLTAQVRAERAGVAVLRAVASRKRPVVVFLDDLQWAGRTPLGFVDLVLGEDPVEGLLLVGAYRDVDMDPAHPLAAPLARWRDQAGVVHLRLGNLPASGSLDMVAEVLHVGRATAEGLAAAITPHARGNPYETVELLNALRRDGALTPSPGGWRWDAAAVRARLGGSEAAGLLARRVEALPAPAREMVEAMACLGGRAEPGVLQAATGAPAGAVKQALAPALGEGVLVAEPGVREAVRFRHDRTREAVLAGLDAQRRRPLQLGMARRLARVPELFAAAAEQYLPMVDAVSDPAERRVVVGLLRRAADQASLIGDHALVEALLAAALRLVDADETGTLIALRTGRHAALYGLGRLEEADEEYRAIKGLGLTAVARADATAVQALSLSQGNRHAEAVGLGIESLRELGVAVPAADQLPGQIDRQFDHLYRWLDHTDATDELARPEISDPALIAVCRLLGAVLPAAYFADPATFAWESLEALRIWLEHGPAPALFWPCCCAGAAAVALRDDYAAGYRAVRRILALGEARGHEPGTSQARYLFVVYCWAFEPIENGVPAGRRAREGLIAGGDLVNGGYAYYSTTYYLLDCAPSLDACVAEVEAGLAFARRTGSEQTGQLLDSYRWLAGVLRGETSPDAAGEAIPIDRYADNPIGLLQAHINRAIATAILGDPAGLARHTEAAMSLLPALAGLYPTAQARLLRGLALAGQARATDGGAERDRLLTELDEVTRWLAERAADSPDNFLHMLRLLDAERAWAAGDFRAAALAFDAALRAAAGRRRPWHRALIAERAARFSLAQGLDHAGHALLAEAHDDYAAWGATAKVAQLDWAYPTLRPEAEPTSWLGGDQSTEVLLQRSTVTTGTVDLLGILSAAQALSSETSIDRLHARVVEVLGALTGATDVRMLVWSDDRQAWLLPAPGGTPGTVPVAGTGYEGAVPTSALRYAQRTREPLVVADATRDDRFARDPYFADVACCALLAVPVLSRGALRALLLLENRLLRGAFTAARLDAVRLVAGQLAVSLDNAQLYAELTASRARVVAAADAARRRLERDLHDGAQQRLVSLALRLRAAQAASPPELGAQLDRAVAEATAALDELRETARGIHPALLTERGLRPALKALARRAPIPATLETCPQERLPEPVEVGAYYLVAEALTNAAKHARATAATVAVEADAAVLRVAVRDDGVGGADPARGTGLVGLKDRVEALGGRLTLDSPPGAGTIVRAELPLPADPAAATGGAAPG
jgi:predicted ATPase/signal transduction histidine kinase